MSKSLKRVRAALQAAGLDTEIRQTEGSRTAQDAARAIGCEVDQIVKSIIFQGQESDTPVLFLTAGGNQVDPEKAATLAREPLGRADADMVRSVTGFAIGGVSPIGHLTPIRSFFDPRLMDFDEIWAAAGTPTHVFGAEPHDMQRISGAEVADFTA